MKPKSTLTRDILVEEARNFCMKESFINHIELLNVTDGKAIGTYIEQKFINHLKEKYEFQCGNSAKGIDIPDEDVLTDIKTTSIQQPQSSCPFASPSQKIYGLGYNLLVFVYNKINKDNECYIRFLNCTYIQKQRTADYTMTKRLREMIMDGANAEDIAGYLIDRNLPLDEVGIGDLSERIIANPPELGYLTISNALQWRLQYKRVIGLRNTVEGVNNYDFQ